MKIKGTKEFEFEISDEQAGEITMKYIKEKFVWDQSPLLRWEINNDGDVVECAYDEFGGAFIRKATEQDKVFYEFLKVFRKMNYQEMRTKKTIENKQNH